MQQPAPAYEGDEPYVFVSYSHQDEALVYREIRWLQDEGVKVWYDTHIQAGSEWPDALANAIAGCSRFLYFITPNAVASENCRRELVHALEEGRPILAVQLQETEVPAGIRLNLNNRQAILKHRLRPDEYATELLGALSQGGASPQFGATTTRSRPIQQSRLIAATAAALLIALAGIWVWQRGPINSFEREATNGQETPKVAHRQSDSRPSSKRTIAVLPASRLGGDERNTSLNPIAAGLTDALRGILSSYPELSTAPEGEAAYVLKTLLADSEDGQPRARFEVTRTSDAQRVWSQVFSLGQYSPLDETKLPRTIARYVRLQTERDVECRNIHRRAQSFQAAEHLCAALADNYQINQIGEFDLELQIINAEKALALDPGLPEAHGIVTTYYALHSQHGLSTEEAWHRVRSHSRAAMTLAPEDPSVLFHRARDVQLVSNLDYDGAVATYQRALALHPLHPLARWLHAGIGEALLRQGQVTQAIEHYRRAVAVYDSDVRIWAEYARLLNVAGRPEDALAATLAGLELTKGGFYLVALRMEEINAYRTLGRHDLASSSYDNTFEIARDWERVFLVAGAGTLLEARTTLDTLPEELRSQCLLQAMLHVRVEDTDGAIDWVTRCVVERNWYILTTLRVDPIYRDIAQDTRWKELLERLRREEVKARKEGKDFDQQ